MLLLALAVAFTLGFAMRLVGLPPMLGFLIAGFALQALGVENTPAIDRIANMGVLLLLFTIGLKLNIKSLFRKHVWQGGAFHMLLTVLIFSIALAGMRLLGFSYFDPLSATNILLISFALSFSSTVFAVKVLEEKGEMKSLMGKTAIAILIIQDILAVLFLTFSKGQYPSAWALLLLGFPLLRKPLLWMMHRTGHGENDGALRAAAGTWWRRGVHTCGYESRPWGTCSRSGGCQHHKI
jgi:predicted Kef-type K+ transport protein